MCPVWRCATQDPLADGPVIQGAATRALERGTTLDGVLAMLGKVAPGLRAPVVLFTYYNPIMRRGADRFCQQIKAAGASGEVARVCACVCVCSMCSAGRASMRRGLRCSAGPMTCALALVALLGAGLLVPDIPLEETADIRLVCEKHGLELVLLTTPTTPQVRACGTRARA